MPRTLLIADSTEAAFRSGIFCFAISSTCFTVTLPTLSLFGVPDPLAMPAARFNRIASRRGLGDERERTIAVDRNHHRNDQSFQFFLRWCER